MQSRMGFLYSQHRDSLPEQSQYSLIKNIDATRINIQGMTGVDDPSFTDRLGICIIYFFKKNFYENTIVLL